MAMAMAMEMAIAIAIAIAVPRCFFSVRSSECDHEGKKSKNHEKHKKHKKAGLRDRGCVQDVQTLVFCCSCL
ncbi:hypothetical protein F5Y12DRAFT_751803, partial [Xylaria sp. FL1777]